MNNIKKIIKTAIVSTAIIIACPAGINAEVLPSRTNDSAAVVSCQKNCATETTTHQCCGMCEKATATAHKGNHMQEQNAFASETKINLNFKFSHNKANFVKAVDVLLIGFSIVFVVMIIFIFVSTGIDKLFPYTKEDEA
ncbi:MAG: hypothetical protein FWF72_02420 [Paludibacter sp.]|nr:hypothetical protein [Paludibacter sp.]